MMGCIGCASYPVVCKRHDAAVASPPGPSLQPISRPLHCPLTAKTRQIVAYNKMDVPDSSDYWEDVREQLAAEGVPADAVFAIRQAGMQPCLVVAGALQVSAAHLCRGYQSCLGKRLQYVLTSAPLAPPAVRSAVSGRGVTDLVRAVRALLDSLPEEDLGAAEEEGRDQQTAAAASLPGRRDTDAKIGEFTIECDLAGPRVWFVKVRILRRLVGCGWLGDRILKPLAWQLHVLGCVAMAALPLCLALQHPWCSAAHLTPP